MAEVDWTRGDLRHELLVQQYDPCDLSTLRGALGADVVSCSVDMDVNSTSRASAKLTVVSDDPHGGWDGTAALRLTCVTSDVTGELRRDALMTGYVRSCEWESLGDIYKTSYELASSLKVVDIEVVAQGMSMPSGSHAVATWAQMARQSGRPYVIDGIDERAYSYDIYFEPGWTVRKIMAYLADGAGGIQDVLPDGRIYLTRYVDPSARQPTYTVDALSSRSPIMGKPSGKDAELDIPGRVVEYAEDRGDWALGTYYITDYGREQRGYLLDEWTKEVQLSPFTSAHALEVAKSRGDAKLGQRAKVQQQLMYRPLTLRDVERLRDTGGISTWYVQAGTLDCSKWVWTLDLVRCDG